MLKLNPLLNLSLSLSSKSIRRVFVFGFRSEITFPKMAINKPQVIFVLGGPGAGKGTQCQMICQEFGYIHLSAGDLLRAERSTPGSKFGELIENHIRNGTIVPVEITCSLLENAMNRYIDKAKESGDQTFGNGKFLIDGFPRNKDNLEGWERQMTAKTDLRFVLFFHCAKDICLDRCIKRGESGSGRSDDNIESMTKRLETYFNDTMPIIEYYDKLHLVKKVDASLSPQEVYKSVRPLLL